MSRYSYKNARLATLAAPDLPLFRVSRRSYRRRLFLATRFWGEGDVEGGVAARWLRVSCARAHGARAAVLRMEERKV